MNETSKSIGEFYIELIGNSNTSIILCNSWKATFRLFILMGVTWIAEVIGGCVDEPQELFLLPDAINILSGVLIFLILVCRKKTIRAVSGKFRPGLIVPHTSSRTEIVSDMSTTRHHQEMNSISESPNNGN